MRKRISLILVVVMLAMLVIAGCGGANTNNKVDKTNDSVVNNDESNNTGNEQDNEEPGGETAQGYKQSPILDGKDLPPVEERLPEEPKITNEMDPSQLDYQIGKFGGTLRMASAVPDWNPDIFVMNNEPLVNTPGLLGEEITPNIVQDFEMSEDQKEFTFYMRKGLRWSDGELVTMEDIEFAINDVMMNEELTPSVNAKYRSGGKPDGTPMELEVIDDYTFKLKFDEPYGGFLMRIAIQGWAAYNDIIKPKHFLKDYHKEYADAAKLEEETKDAGYGADEWFNLFHDIDVINTEVTNKKAIGFPCLNPWVMATTSAQVETFERNPYYFKVDAEGNQLPYIDEVQTTITPDTEVLNMNILAGELDYTRESTALIKTPLYKENEERSGFKTVILTTHGRPGNFYLNLTYDDPTWREVVQDLRFRQALNYGINRQEIIDTIYYGFAELPDKWAPTDFDPDKANELLDEMGLDKRDSDGWRLGPDGKVFRLDLEVSSRVPETIPQTEILVECWKDLGIHTTMKTIENALWGNRTNANEIMATVERMEDYWWQGDMKPQYSAPLWNNYHTSGGEKGEEPPEEYKELLINADKSMSAAVDEAYAAHEANVKSIHDNLFFIVVVTDAEQPMIVNKDLGNVPHSGTTIAANFAGEQFFFDR